MSTEGFGTITPFSGSFKVGLDDSVPPVVKALPKSAVAKWTVQNPQTPSDSKCYRLFVNNGKDYALNRPADSEISITASEGSPASSDSHVWYIGRFSDGYYYIQDMRTNGAWKMVESTIKLATLPLGNDGLEPFKFKFTFSS